MALDSTIRTLHDEVAVQMFTRQLTSAPEITAVVT
jgi:hypothetical protein